MTFSVPARFAYAFTRATGVIKLFTFMVYVSPYAVKRPSKAARPNPDMAYYEQYLSDYPDQGTRRSVVPTLLEIIGETISYLGERYKYQALGLVVVSLIAYDLSQRPWRNYLSRVLDWANNRYSLHSSTVRSSFNNSRNYDVQLPQNHPHPHAAATRSAAVNTIRHMIANLGKTCYSVQTSSRDDRDNISGSRDYYWGKDLHIRARKDLMTRDHIPYLIDVDYYIDMNSFLCDAKRTVYLYSLQPSRAAVTTNKDYSYKWNSDQEIVYTVAGSSYRHKVWNYQSDSIGANDFSSWFFWNWSATAYAIEKRNVDQDHEIVCLTPTGTWYGLFALLARYLVTFRMLTRMEPVRGNIVCIETRTTEHHVVSLGHVDRYSESTLPAKIVDTAVTMNQVNSVNMGIAAAKALINKYAEEQGFDKPTIDEAAAMLVDYVKAGAPTRETVVFPREHAVRRYQFGQFEPEAKPSMVAFMSPLVHEAFAPDSTPGNEVRQVYGRLEKFQSKERTRAHFTWIYNCIDDFVNGLVKEPHSLHPVDREEVWIRQGRPSQQQILRQADYGDPFDTTLPLESFTKKEAYSGPNDPRMITTDRPSHKAYYSQFIYALADTMYDVEWYAFGRKPIDIAHKVASICGAATTNAGVSDFSRFDGHVDEIARVLELRFITRAFNECYTDELVELHGATYQRKGVGRMGTMYNGGYSRASGMPDTSLGNTILNAFVAYLSCRIACDAEGVYNTHETAVRFLDTKCIFGGDDGLVADPYDTWMKAAEIVNQNLDLCTIAKGELGVTFLSRYYGPNVWYGDVNSCIDVPRQLRKFHVTPHLPPHVSPMEKFAEKVRSLCLSDSESPILGPLAKYFSATMNVDALVKHAGDALFHMRRWDSQFDRTVQYPNFEADWMFTIVDAELIDFDLRKFEHWLIACKDDKRRYLTPPLCVEPLPPTIKATVTVDDDVFVVAGSNPEERAEVPRVPPLTVADSKPNAPANPPKQPKKTPKPPASPTTPPAAPSTSKGKQDNRQKKPSKEKKGKEDKTPARPVVQLVRKDTTAHLEEKSDEPSANERRVASHGAPQLGGPRGAGKGSNTKA